MTDYLQWNQPKSSGWVSQVKHRLDLPRGR
jgi:hypothetical protein